MKDAEIEVYWMELEDVLLYEDNFSILKLNEDWLHFKKHTTQNKILQWFDDFHSKGLLYLANEYEGVLK